MRNHLEAEPEDDSSKAPKKKDPSSEEDSVKEELERRFGPPTIEKLNEDNQVMRALEILRSHNILTDRSAN